MLRAFLARRAAAREDRGAALIVVIGLTAVMLLVVGTALTSASSGLAQAVSAQGSARALDAAYAGVQDYIAKLNADSTYPQYRNPDAAFSSTSTGSLPTATNAAMDTGTSGTWGAMPKAATDTDTTASTFRYEVDNSQYGSSGLLRLRSTGRYGAFTKTIVASIQQQGFINYLYFTNYETADPQITGSGASCDTYLWSTPARSTTGCPTIQFGPNDVLRGPIRSNDTISVCGSKFQGAVVSANPGTPIIATPAGCTATATYAVTPTYAPVLSMPETNTSMRTQTYSDRAANPGCMFTGPTQITLNGDGTMTVVSPWTKFTRVTSDNTSGTNPSVCGSLADLHSTKGATFAVPSSNLVFVQNVPSVTSDVNYTPSTAPTTTTTTTSTSACTSAQYQAGNCTTSSGAACNSGRWQTGQCVVTTTTTTTGPQADGAVPSSVTQTTWSSGASYTCTGADGSATATTSSGGSAGWIFKDANGTLRYPLSNESPASNWDNGSAWDTTTPAYGCRNGDAFVSGTLNGRLTIASDNYVYATGDVLYKDATGDVLGLVGNNGVLVWNPMNGTTPILTGQNREIDAAILSPAHTFQVQNYNVGSYRGVLTIQGSIAQKYRGPVATTNGTSTVTGYSKKYGYDMRFGAVTPPYYLKPTSASFRVSSYAGTKAAYTSTGAAG